MAALLMVTDADASEEAFKTRQAALDLLQCFFRKPVAWKEHEERENQERPALKDRQKDADDADDGEDDGERQPNVDHLRDRISARYSRGIFWNSVTPSRASSSLLIPSARVRPSISPSLPSSSQPVQMSVSL